MTAYNSAFLRAFECILDMSRIQKQYSTRMMNRTYHSANSTIAYRLIRNIRYDINDQFVGNIQYHINDEQNLLVTDAAFATI